MGLPQTLEVVGRDDEIAVLLDFLESVEALPGVLLIRGEAGIGKTTLWEQAVSIGRERSYRVLSYRASAAEVQLSYAALGDLLGDVAAEALEDLPRPQRRGLEVALLLEEAGDRPPEPRAIAAGLLGALSRLSRTGPLLVAIDDVQWLDTSSATTLEFAIRRLREEPIGFVLAQRIDGAARPPLGLDLDATGTRQVDLGPLSLGALHRLLTARIGTAFTRPTLRRLQDVSAGNPFFALQLAQALQERGVKHTVERLPLPETVHDLLGDRLTPLPERTREALLLASATSQPTFGLLSGALGAGAETILGPAVESGIVKPEGDAIRFVHPLFAEVVYDAAGATSRRRAHKQLAGVSSDLEERARHLALSTAGPDAEVAALLDEAARTARARGAAAAAADLLEQALAKTQPEDVDARAVRTVNAADALMLIGDRGKARALLEAAVNTLDAGPLRSDVLALLSELVAGDEEGGEKRRALIEQSLREAGQDPRRRAEALLRRDIWERSQDRLADALEAARAAVALAEEVGDDRLLARALTRKVDLEVLLGLAEDPSAHFRRVLELDEKLRIDPFLGPPSMLAVCLVRAGRVDEARPLLLRQHTRAVEEGNEDARIWLSLFLAELEWLAGRWADSSEWAREGLELAEQCEARLLSGALLSVLALVEASCGAVDAARIHATEGLELCESIIEVAYALQNRYALGFLELSLGNPAAAHEHLSGFGFERGIEGTKRISFIGDEIEALVQLGEAERAAELVDELERRGHRLHRQTLLGVAGRCRGLVLASGSDSQAAVGSLQSAVEIFASLNLPFERARTLLVLGEVLRRGKQKRAAREALDAALVIFEELGAKLWAEKARAELARVSGRAPAGGLTPTEGRIAELVAEGRSNKEVAAALFVTVKTVERNLTRIYEKLGVRSRTELAHRLAAEEAAKAAS